MDENQPRQIQGLPENPKLSNFNWYTDESKMAFTHTTDKGMELWVVDIAQAQAKKLTQANLNTNMHNPIDWFKDGSPLHVRLLPLDRKKLSDIR